MRRREERGSNHPGLPARRGGEDPTSIRLPPLIAFLAFVFLNLISTSRVSTPVCTTRYASKEQKLGTDNWTSVEEEEEEEEDRREEMVLRSKSSLAEGE